MSSAEIDRRTLLATSGAALLASAARAEDKVPAAAEAKKLSEQIADFVVN